MTEKGAGRFLSSQRKGSWGQKSTLVFSNGAENLEETMNSSC